MSAGAEDTEGRIFRQMKNSNPENINSAQTNATNKHTQAFQSPFEQPWNEIRAHGTCQVLNSNKVGLSQLGIIYMRPP
jgi:hypothetical protein